MAMEAKNAVLSTRSSPDDENAWQEFGVSAICDAELLDYSIVTARNFGCDNQPLGGSLGYPPMNRG